MSVKQYYIVDNTTSKISFVASVEDNLVGTLYPNTTAIEVPPISENIPRAYAGYLYKDGVFWMPLYRRTIGGVTAGVMTYRHFRGMFSEDELMKFDSFESDSGLTVPQKNSLRTMFKNLETVGAASQDDPIYISSAQQLLSIGYITQGRFDSIKVALGVA